MEFFYGVLFGLGLQLVAALIVGIWLVLLIRFGVLPMIFEYQKASSDERTHTTRMATRIILGIELLSVPIMPLLCCNEQFIFWLAEFRVVKTILGFTYSPVLLVLIVEGWLVLIFHFGWQYLSDGLSMSVDLHQRIGLYLDRIILFIGVITGLFGFVWWNSIPEDKFEDVYRLGLVILSPATSLLTAGMVVMLPISLVQTLKPPKSNEQSATLMRNITLALLVVLVVLSVAGGVWSVLMYRHFWHGTGLVPG
jgi:hypothetical protein